MGDSNLFYVGLTRALEHLVVTWSGRGAFRNITGCAGESDQFLQMRTRAGKRERKRGGRGFERNRELCQGGGGWRGSRW